MSDLEAEVHDCARCERLVGWLERVRHERRAAFRDVEYWCRPVPGFGPAQARLLLVGLAPGAHGANRTGRPFTGDGAGPFLYGALHRAGLASAPRSEGRGDGLRLIDTRITNAVRCAPPGNRPSAEEIANCGDYLARELARLPRLRVVVCLGGVAWSAVLAALARSGQALPRPRPRFGHGCTATLESGPTLIGCFHPSQLNTFTGRLTPAMIDEVLVRARELAQKGRTTRDA